MMRSAESEASRRASVPSVASSAAPRVVAYDWSRRATRAAGATAVGVEVRVALGVALAPVLVGGAAGSTYTPPSCASCADACAPMVVRAGRRSAAAAGRDALTSSDRSRESTAAPLSLIHISEPTRQ